MRAAVSQYWSRETPDKSTRDGQPENDVGRTSPVGEDDDCSEQAKKMSKKPREFRRRGAACQGYLDIDEFGVVKRRLFALTSTP